MRALQQPPELVGRDSERDALGEFLEALADGPAALVLEGDAGIGESALWSEGVRLAREREYAVLAVRTTQAEAQLPFVVLGDLFAAISQQAGSLLVGASLYRREAWSAMKPVVGSAS